MTYVVVKTCLNQELVKISTLIQVIFRVTHVGDRNLTEERIDPKAEFHRMPNVPKFRSSEVWIEHTT